MANSIVLRKLFEGPRHLIVMASFLIDTTAEMTDQVIIDPAGAGVGDPVPVLGSSGRLTVESIWGNTTNMGAYLEFDATTDSPIFTLTGTGGDSFIDFAGERGFGGIKDPSSSGATGKIQVTTVGATANTSIGTFIIRVRKD